MDPLDRNTCAGLRCYSIAAQLLIWTWPNTRGLVLRALVNAMAPPCYSQIISGPVDLRTLPTFGRQAHQGLRVVCPIGPTTHINGWQVYHPFTLVTTIVNLIDQATHFRWHPLLSTIKVKIKAPTYSPSLVEINFFGDQGYAFP